MARVSRQPQKLTKDAKVVDFVYIRGIGEQCIADDWFTITGKNR